jgi:hypothetical protein
MNCTKFCGGRLAVTCVVLIGTLLATASPASATLIVDDSWADAGRTNGADPLDTDWWSSTATSAIEVGNGFLGLVTTATNGRGIHGTFPSQTLASVGDKLTATYMFTTPAVVGTAKAGGFKIGLFDTTGKPGLAADISASTATPNAIYNNLNGYMLDYDVNTGATANLNFSERTNAGSGQLLAVAGDYTALNAGGGTSYSFLANTSYTGVFSVTKTATGLDLTGSLSLAATPLIPLSTFTASEATPTTSTFGMLGFHVNSAVFSGAGIGGPGEGIDFTNIKIETASAVPEPSGLVLLALGGLLATGIRQRYVRSLGVERA